MKGNTKTLDLFNELSVGSFFKLSYLNTTETFVKTCTETFHSFTVDTYSNRDWFEEDIEITIEILSEEKQKKIKKFLETI